MFLLDTNIWPERLLGQKQSAVVGQLLERLPTDRMFMTDFTLHSLGVILNRLGHGAVLTVFAQDMLIDGEVSLAGVPATSMYRVVEVMEKFRLDFDDAYQYVAAEHEDARIISFDGHFDPTDRGRQTPSDLLAELSRS